VCTNLSNLSSSRPSWLSDRRRLVCECLRSICLRARSWSVSWGTVHRLGLLSSTMRTSTPLRNGALFMEIFQNIFMHLGCYQHLNKFNTKATFWHKIWLIVRILILKMVKIFKMKNTKFQELQRRQSTLLLLLWMQNANWQMKINPHARNVCPSPGVTICPQCATRITEAATPQFSCWKHFIW